VLDQEGMIAGREGRYRTEPGPFLRHRYYAARLEDELGTRNGPIGEIDGRHHPVPGDQHGRKQSLLGGIQRAQRLRGIFGTVDRGAECRAHANERLGLHRDRPVQAVHILRVDAHPVSEGGESFRVIHGRRVDPRVECFRIGRESYPAGAVPRDRDLRRP
jgi:hypothetical protein